MCIILFKKNKQAAKAENIFLGFGVAVLIVFLFTVFAGIRCAPYKELTPPEGYREPHVCVETYYSDGSSYTDEWPLSVWKMHRPFCDSSYRGDDIAPRDLHRQNQIGIYCRRCGE